MPQTKACPLGTQEIIFFSTNHKLWTSEACGKTGHHFSGDNDDYSPYIF